MQTKHQHACQLQEALLPCIRRMHSIAAGVLGCCQPGICRGSRCCLRSVMLTLQETMKASTWPDRPHLALSVIPRLTLPSITATHELVVPRSIPMTSSALRALETLHTQAMRPQSLQMGQPGSADKSRVGSSPQATHSSWQGLLEPCLHKQTVAVMR